MMPDNSPEPTAVGAVSSASRAYSPVGPRTFTEFTSFDPAWLSLVFRRLVT
jgi:hypothetical protein